MFLCLPCHGEDCDYRMCRTLAGRSYGRCEACGETATCVDCHRPLTPAEREIAQALADLGREGTDGDA